MKGFVNVPIHTFMESVYWDDIGYTSCNFAAKVFMARAPLDSSYTDVLFTREALAQPYATQFN